MIPVGLSHPDTTTPDPLSTLAHACMDVAAALMDNGWTRSGSMRGKVRYVKDTRVIHVYDGGAYLCYETSQKATEGCVADPGPLLHFAFRPDDQLVRWHLWEAMERLPHDVPGERGEAYDRMYDAIEAVADGLARLEGVPTSKRPVKPRGLKGVG